MAVKKTRQCRAKTSKEMRRIGFYGGFLNQLLHGGGCSTCPPKYLVSSGSNSIVILHYRENQIIANNLYGDHNDNVLASYNLSMVEMYINYYQLYLITLRTIIGKSI